jgi:hypothetical protein
MYCLMPGEVVAAKPSTNIYQYKGDNLINLGYRSFKSKKRRFLLKLYQIESLCAYNLLFYCIWARTAFPPVANPNLRKLLSQLMCRLSPSIPPASCSTNLHSILPRRSALNVPPPPYRPREWQLSFPKISSTSRTT